MMTSLGVAVSLVVLGMAQYVDSSCDFSTILNARTERSRQLVYQDGERVLTMCFAGHATDDLQTEFMRTCTGGQWLPDLQCNPITCTGLPVVEDADVLFLSEMEVVDNEYPLGAVALIICPTGMSTDRGRIRYYSGCSYTSAWNDTSPCSVALRAGNTQYSAYQVQLTEISLQFNSALSDPTSPQAQELAESLDRALFTMFNGEFGASYVGSQDYVFSDSAQGLRVDFTMLFLPSVSMETEALRMRIISSLTRVDYQSTDPNSGTLFTFQRNTLDVSEVPVSQFTREARIGLSIAGVAVAILAFTLLIVCCCCRRNKKIIAFKGFSRPRPVPYVNAPPGPPPAIVSPYAQISDVPYRLPRI